MGFVDVWEILGSLQCEPRLAACVEKPLEDLGLTHEVGSRGVTRAEGNSVSQLNGEFRFDAWLLAGWGKEQ